MSCTRLANACIKELGKNGDVENIAGVDEGACS